jgi:hypothetical protein
MRGHRRSTTGAPPPAAAAGGLGLLGALTVAAFSERFTALHTDERTAAAIAAAAAAISTALTVAYGSTPPPLRRLSRAAGIYVVAVLAAAWLVTDMTTTGW